MFSRLVILTTLVSPVNKYFVASQAGSADSSYQNIESSSRLYLVVLGSKASGLPKAGFRIRINR